MELLYSLFMNAMDLQYVENISVGGTDKYRLGK